MLNSPSFTLSVWGMHGGQRTTLGISLHLPCNLPMCYCVPQVSLPTSFSGFFCLCLPSNGSNIGLGWHAGGPVPGFKWILNSSLYSWQSALYYPVSELISTLHSSAYLIFYEVTGHFQKWDSKLFVWNFSDLFLAFSNFGVRFVSCVICTSVWVDASLWFPTSFVRFVSCGSSYWVVFSWEYGLCHLEGRHKEQKQKQWFVSNRVIEWKAVRCTIYIPNEDRK